MNLLRILGFAVWALRQGAVPRLDPAHVLSLQRRRLRRLLRLAVAGSPFYRDKYRNLDVARCELAELPTTTKLELRDRFDDVVTDPRLRRAEIDRYMQDPDNAPRPYLGRYALCHTSGSSGEPLTVVHPLESLNLLFALQMTRGNARRATLAKAVGGLLRPFRLAVLTMTRGFFPTALAWNHAPPPARALMQILRLNPADPDLAGRLNAFRPNAITAYPSILDRLALEKDRLRLAPDLLQVTSNSETLTVRQRAEFAAAFGVPVLNNYAMGECLCLSNGCPTDPGAHVNADWAVVEVTDEHGRPVPSGGEGHKLLVTDLTNRVMPIIRYEVGDRATWAAAPCGCGSRLPRLEGVSGRTADYFWVRDGDSYRQLLSLLFAGALLPAPEVRDWQAVQESRNRIRLRLQLAGGGAEVDRPLHLVREQLDSVGLGGVVDLTAEVVPALDVDPGSGKLRRMLSRVGPPPDLKAPGPVPAGAAGRGRG